MSDLDTRDDAEARDFIVSANLDGKTHQLSIESDDGTIWRYGATINAPPNTSYNVNSEHYYPVKVSASDGNSEVVLTPDDEILGEAVRLFVKEIDKPIISSIYPQNNAEINKSTFLVKWKVLDSGSGINQESIRITVDNIAQIESDIEKTKINQGYLCTFNIDVPVVEGAHIINFSASDNDGNIQNEIINFIVDISAPIISISSPNDDVITKEKTINVTGNISDAISNDMNAKIQVNSGLEETLHLKSDGTFSKDVFLTEGKNVIEIIATDAGGNSSYAKKRVVLDTIPPYIHGVLLSDNPVNVGEKLKVYITITDGVEQASLRKIPFRFGQFKDIQTPSNTERE